MNEKHPVLKAIWAIDPFQAEGPALNRVTSALKRLAESGTSIEPVYVLGPEEYELYNDRDPSWPSKVRAIIEKMIQTDLEGHSIPRLLPPRVLTSNRDSLRHAARLLSKYALRSGADTIVVGTHARKGIQRLFLGSFAETLLLVSDLPVLVLNPEAAEWRARWPRRILFATDLKPSSRTAFDKVLALAKAQGARILLVHRLPHTARALAQAGIYLVGGAYTPLPELAQKDESRKEATVQRYARLAAKRGVPFESRLVSGTDNTAEAVADAARETRADLIVIAAQSGPVAQTLLGSVTRQVVRTAPCPVWVLRGRWPK
jgi:nucleotide-binding universal stress UspA family protein